MKLKWRNRYRNIVLVSTILGLTFYAFPILLGGREGAEVMIALLKINPLMNLLGNLIGVFLLYSQWQGFNRINEEKPRLSKTEIVLGALIILLMLLFVFLLDALLIYSIIMGKPIGEFLIKNLTGFFMMPFLIFFLFMYPMTIYWEWKNKEDNLSC